MNHQCENSIWILYVRLSPDLVYDLNHLGRLINYTFLDSSPEFWIQRVQGAVQIVACFFLSSPGDADDEITQQLA